MTKLRACIIGTGHIAQFHVRGLLARGSDIEIAAVQDIDPDRAKRFAAEFGISRHYGTAAQMLAQEQPDLVHICTPPSSHAALVIQCLEAGAHVLCEKPLCASLEELNRIQEAERRSGRFCATVFQKRYSASTQHVRSIIAEGQLGAPLIAICNTLWYRPPAYYDVPWRGKWATELGGPTVGHGIHAMDQLLFMLGAWECVHAVARRLDRPIEVEDLSAAIVEFRSGCVATIVNSILSPREETYLRFDLQHATIELRHLYDISNVNWQFTAAPTAERTVFARLSNLPADSPANHTTQISAVIDDILNETRPLTVGNEAFNTIELLTAIYKAAFTGTTIHRGTILSGDPFYSSFHGGRVTWNGRQCKP